MRRPVWVLLAGVLLAAAGLRAEEAPEIEALDKAFQKVFARVEPSVVAILIGREAYDRYDDKKPRGPGELGRFDAAALLARVPEGDATERRRIADLDLTAPGHLPEATATGVVLDKAGLILVPAHAVVRARKIYVKLPGGKGSFADIHALDPRSDLAVLRLLDPPDDLQPAPLGDGGALRRGQLVLLLANPHAAGVREPSATASWGMVVNLRRRLSVAKDESEASRPTLHHFGTMLQIQTHFHVPPGGVVLNPAGEVVGLTTVYTVSRQDRVDRFAFPLDEGLRRIIGVLRRGEEVEYGFLGVSVQTAGLGGGRGAEVSGVSPASPARAAGLIGDGRETILRIDGRPVDDTDDLFLLIGTKLAGTPVKIEYQPRPGSATRTTTVTLGKFWVQTPGMIASRRRPPVAGLRVDWLTILTQQNRRLREGEIPSSGVVVREVLPDSPAARAGLQIDDVITHVGTTRVATPDEFYKAMAAGKGLVKVVFQTPDRHEKEVELPR